MLHVAGPSDGGSTRLHRLTEFAIRWPRLTVLVAVLIASLGAWSAVTAPASAGAYAMIGSDHPAVIELESFLRRFGGGQPVVIAWRCDESADPCQSVFDDTSLRMAYEVGSVLTSSPHVARISSPAHSPLFVSGSDEIGTHRFVAEGIVNAAPEYVQLALSDPLWRGAIISSDARVGALIVETDSSDTTDQASVVAAIEEAIAPHQANGFRFALSGYPWIHVASYRGMAADGLLVGSVTIAVIGICSTTA